MDVLDMKGVTENEETSAVKGSRNKVTSAAAGIAVLLLFPALAFYLLELYTRNPFREVRPWAQFFNILLLEFAAWILFCLFGRVRTALRTELTVVMLFGIANAYVIRFRSNQILPWDLFSIKTAASVASNYDYTPEPRMIYVTLAFLVLIAGLQFVKYKLHKTAFYKRLIGACGITLLLILFAGRLQDETFQLKHRLYTILFSSTHMTKVNGTLVTFVMDLVYMSVEKPPEYDKGDAQAALDRYRTQEETVTELPNIIVIMNEAFSDPGVLGTMLTSEDYMPFYHSLRSGMENTVTGMLNVSVCGGNTANTEFEFLTGNTMAFLPQGSVPYQQYIAKEMDALPRQLDALGYRTVALHPYYPSGWERDVVYPRLGFEESYFIYDYDRENVVRDYISDEECVNKMIQMFEEKKEGEPLFLFNVTMQNHGGYRELFDNFTPDITSVGTDSVPLNQYLSLIKLSDQQLERLISYFSATQEKTMVVFFGDHQPADTVVAPVYSLNGKSVNELTEEELKLRYQVPYVVWANFDIPEQSGADTSANFLSAEVLRMAGMETTPYQNFLLELKEEYPIISGIRVKKSDQTETNAASEEEGLLLYRQLQYYQLFD